MTALPYQCLGACNRSQGDSREWKIFGASGSRLVAQSSSGASFVWSAEDADAKDDKSEEEPQEPPGKKIKLSPSTEQASQKSNFSCLVVSNDKRHLVAVTAEDKCIRVFEIGSDCRLHQLSQRCMAKRPCSITLTLDDSTILCADKFGDVYALPLMPSVEDDLDGAPAAEQEEVTDKQYTPAASVLTVHSGRNRKVLEEQLKQASKGPKRIKEPLKFKHELLLGHVSMLTDILYTTVDSRSYIITADRDEHIRVSRGLPQAHIIEGFCQGHEEFISRLCLTKSGLLVSGGGDANLLIWDWLQYRLVQKVCIRDYVLKYYRENPQLASVLAGDEASLKTAVCGIWSVPSHEAQGDVILVGCEGIPALFSFKLGLGSVSTSGEAIPLNGNVLDVAFIGSSGACTAVVAVDNVHKPGSTTETHADEGAPRLQYLSYQTTGTEGTLCTWGEDSTVRGRLEWFNRAGDAAGRGAEFDTKPKARLGDEKAMRDMLYGIENLRKRAGAED